MKHTLTPKRVPIGSRQRRQAAGPQRGAVLVVTILMLIVVVILGLLAAASSGSDERMARNSRDYNLALQAAEAALRDARTDALTTRALNFASSASATCDATGFKGVCIPAIAPNANVWTLYLDDTTRSVGYGEITGLSAAQKFALAPTPGGVSAQPRYLIEILPDTEIGSLRAGQARYMFRFTAVGYGVQSGTRVVVQEVYRP
jgi:type IV pilus assembly protein PilX